MKTLLSRYKYIAVLHTLEFAYKRNEKQQR